MTEIGKVNNNSSVSLSGIDLDIIQALQDINDAFSAFIHNGKVELSDILELAGMSADAKAKTAMMLRATKAHNELADIMLRWLLLGQEPRN